MHDVVIVGGSFAGLAVAMRLRGHRVLIIDQHPIGSHQMSTCGVPLRLATMLDAEDAVMELHDAAFVYVTGRQFRFQLPEPYVTFDYEKLCKRMLAQTDAEVLIARATERREGQIVTTKGGFSGRHLVIACGWRAFPGGLNGGSRELPLAARGIETEIPVRVDIDPGLHFYFERKIVEHGYAWVFPCGDYTRIGLGSSQDQMALRRRLDYFLSELGQQIGPTHGGVMPVVRQSPIVDGAFVVGDAAGQCLPLTFEGIRIAVRHGLACGELIDRTLRGEIHADAARRRYVEIVRQTDRSHRRLMRLMTFIDHAPEPILALVALLTRGKTVSDFLIRRYLSDTGWPAAGLPEPVAGV